jgi:hypothetical protein
MKIAKPKLTKLSGIHGIQHGSNSEIEKSYFACRKCIVALRDGNSIL